MEIDTQAYLDRPGLKYFNAINGETAESLALRTSEIARFKTHLPNPQIIVSVGVGQGEEIHAIHELYNGSVSKIIGVDMSQIAILAAKKRALRYVLPAEFLLGSATNLPLASESVDGIVLSSLMHEIHSYSPDGKEAWNKAIQDSARVLREGGCILLRDSAAPELEGSIQVKMGTDLARDFYDYFAREFRAFNGWENSLKGKFSLYTPPFPPSNGVDTVTLSVGQAAELLFHFVNFEMGYPNDPNFIGNKNWKELNEVYYTPKSNDTHQPMSTDEYVVEVLKQGNLVLGDEGLKLVCAEQGSSVRPRMYRPISEHFDLSPDDASSISPEISEQLIQQFINKMELVFKKVRV